jgi:hypothetical protein
VTGFNLTAPCGNCPFRNDGKEISLRPGRLAGIKNDLLTDRVMFQCHKKPKEHCAGALIWLELNERPSQMMRIAERLSLYDRTKLTYDKVNQ